MPLQLEFARALVEAQLLAPARRLRQLSAGGEEASKEALKGLLMQARCAMLCYAVLRCAARIGLGRAEACWPAGAQRCPGHALPSCLMAPPLRPAVAPPQIEGVLGGARTCMPDLPSPAWGADAGIFACSLAPPPWQQPLGLVGCL